MKTISRCVIHSVCFVLKLIEFYLKTKAIGNVMQVVGAGILVYFLVNCCSAANFLVF